MSKYKWVNIIIKYNSELTLVVLLVSMIPLLCSEVTKDDALR